jgi:AcrR family transcriptional regulator
LSAQPSDGSGAAQKKKYNSRRRDARRERILDAAAEIFRRRGFGTANIDEIGAAAGVSGPAVYYYFDTKADLLAAVFFRLGDEMVLARDKALSGVVDPQEILSVLVATYINSVLKRRDLIPLLYQDDQHLPPDAFVESRRRRRSWYQFWGRALKQARPELTEREADTIAAGAMWLIHSVAFHDSVMSAARLRRLLNTMALASLGIGSVPSAAV